MLHKLFGGVAAADEPACIRRTRRYLSSTNARVATLSFNQVLFHVFAPICCLLELSTDACELPPLVEHEESVSYTHLTLPTT